MNIDVKRHSVRFVAVLFFLATAWIQAPDLSDFATRVKSWTTRPEFISSLRRP